MLDLDEIGPGVYADIAMRLADEGVPTRAIARALDKEHVGVKACIQRYINNGRLVFLPRDDWPPGTSREDRLPSIPVTDITGDKLLVSLVQTFKVTKLQARILAVLLHRPLVTKDHAHNVIEEGRGPRSEDERTQLKLVDVVICHLRKRLKPFDLNIETSWACGYFMTSSDQKKALSILEGKVLTVPVTTEPFMLPESWCYR